MHLFPNSNHYYTLSIKRVIINGIYIFFRDLRKTNYADYYCRKFPSLYNSCSDEPSQITEGRDV